MSGSGQHDRSVQARHDALSRSSIAAAQIVSNVATAFVDSDKLDVKIALGYTLYEAAQVLMLCLDRFSRLRGTSQQITEILSASMAVYPNTNRRIACISQLLLPSILKLIEVSDDSYSYALLNDDIILKEKIVFHAKRMDFHLENLELPVLDSDIERDSCPISWEPPRSPKRPPHFITLPNVSAPFEPASIGEFLHAATFGIELCAAEICASNLGRWMDSCPPGLILDMSRQTYDEVRHFELLRYVIEREGAELGQYPVDTALWSKYLLADNLAEALMIEQRLGEGIGLDGGARLHREFARWGDVELTEIFDFINADEMCHVREGNQWLRVILGGPDQVALLDASIRQKLESAGFPVVHEKPINETDRELAGFTANEIRAISLSAASRA